MTMVVRLESTLNKANRGVCVERSCVWGENVCDVAAVVVVVLDVYCGSKLCFTLFPNRTSATHTKGRIYSCKRYDM